MIVECTACHARFRLDESKIKGKGARVRCRRCGESILVLKTAESAEPPAEKPGEESLDLRSIVRDTLGERRTAASSPDTAGSSPGPSAVAPPPAPAAEEPSVPGTGKPEEAPPPPEVPVPERAESPEAPAPAEEPERKDAGEAIREPVAQAASASPPSEQEEPSGKPDVTAGEEEAVPVQFQPEEKMEIPSIDFGESSPPEPTEQASPEPEPAEPEPRAAEPPPTPEPPPPEEPDFLMSSHESLGYLSEEPAKKPAGDALDISASLSRQPKPPEPEPEAVPPPPVAADFLTQAAEPPPVEPPAESSPPPPKAPVPPPAPEPQKPKPPEPLKAPSRLLRPSLAALILLFLALAGGGAYLGFTERGQEMLRGMLPGMESFWLQGKGRSAAQYDVRNLVGFYERDTAAGTLFVIKGQVTNVGRVRKTGTRVQAALLDANDNTIAEKTCYAGNVIEGEALKTSSRETINGRLSNRFGDGLANMDVPPGKTVPFMVVFFDAPAGISAYRLEAREGE